MLQCNIAESYRTKCTILHSEPFVRYMLGSASYMVHLWDFAVDINLLPPAFTAPTLENDCAVHPRLLFGREPTV